MLVQTEKWGLEYLHNFFGWFLLGGDGLDDLFFLGFGVEVPYFRVDFECLARDLDEVVFFEEGSYF